MTTPTTEELAVRLSIAKQNALTACDQAEIEDWDVEVLISAVRQALEGTDD